MELLDTGKTTLSFRKGSDIMFYIILQPKVPANSKAHGEGEAKEAVRNVLALHRAKVMTVFSMSEKEKGLFRRRELLAQRFSKQGERVSKLIRIKLEDIKGRVRAQSPSALQFIGPGD